MKKNLIPSSVRKAFNSVRNRATKKSKIKSLSVFVLGSERTGKSSLINVICDDDFSDAYSPTRFDLYEKVLGKDNNNESAVHTGDVKFVFFDISGRNSCPMMRREYISKADIFILVYSQDQQGSFKQLLRHKTEIEEVKNERISEMSVCVVRNKTDLEKKRVDDKKLSWCRSVFHCSAKFGINISHLIDFLTTESLSAGNIVERKLNKGVSGRYIYADNDRSKCISLVQPKSYYGDEIGDELSIGGSGGTANR